MSIVEARIIKREAPGVVLHGIQWSKYLELREMPENYHLRMTFDAGELTIMSPSRLHELIAELLNKLIDVWTDELDLPLESCSTMTIRRKDLQRGFEPDNCYYIQNEHKVWKKTKLNFKTDPPPDLAIEVEESRSGESKVEIYATFGVPELWRIVRQRIRVFVLDQDGNYHAMESSSCFPNFPLAKVNEILKQIGKDRQKQLVRSFRSWVRANYGPDGTRLDK